MCQNIDLNEVIADEGNGTEYDVRAAAAALDENLITPKIHDKARQQILDTFDSGGFFCYSEGDRKEEFHGHTQNSC